MKKLLIISLLFCVAGTFAAALPESAEESCPVLVAQAVHRLTREFRLTQDQQKMLSDRLHEISQAGKFRGYAGKFRGCVDMSAAREVALGIKEMPTQAGPADIKVEEVEEKEDADGGNKVGKAIKKSPQRENVERVVSEFLPPKLVSTLVGDYVFVMPWNIKFKPGELSTKFECGSFKNFQASSDGRYVAVQKSSKDIDIWDMQEMRVVRQLVMEEPGERWVFSPAFEMAAAFNYATGDILIANAKNGRIIRHLEMKIDLLNWPNSSLRFFYGEDGNLQLIVNNSSSLVLIWDVESGKIAYTKNIHIAYVKKALRQFSFDGQYFFGLEQPPTSLFVGKVSTGELIYRIRLTTKYAYFDMIGYYASVLDFDNKRMAAVAMADSRGYILVWNLQTKEQLCSIALPRGGGNPLVPITFSPDGRYLLSGDMKSGALFFDLQACEREYREKIAQGKMDGIVTGVVIPMGSEVESKEAAAAKPANALVSGPKKGGPVAAAPVPASLPRVSRRLTVAQIKKEFVVPSTIRKRTAWINGLNDLAATSADHMINYEDAWQLYEDIKNR